MPTPSLLASHVTEVLGCRLCPKMHRPPVTGGPVQSKVMLIGQAPGIKEPVAQRPFAWTAGKTMFGWFQRALGVDEATFRQTVYMAAVCRCFPGRNPAGGDRVPDAQEIVNCSRWLQREFALLQPTLVIPVGKLAIAQFIPVEKLAGIIGQAWPVHYHGHACELVPLPHPSGASTWHRMEPGKTLLNQALERIAAHPAWRQAQSRPHLSGEPRRRQGAKS